jgi:hypothetical protein
MTRIGRGRPVSDYRPLTSSLGTRPVVSDSVSFVESQTVTADAVAVSERAVLPFTVTDTTAFTQSATISSLITGTDLVTAFDSQALSLITADAVALTQAGTITATIPQADLLHLADAGLIDTLIIYIASHEVVRIWFGAHRITTVYQGSSVIWFN